MPINRAIIDQLKAGDIALLGIPFDDHSSFLKGPAKAPELIIAAIESDSANYYTEDITDLNNHPRLHWIGNIDASVYQSISNPIKELVDKGVFPLSLGGDHSTTYPVIRGLHGAFPKLTILHFDAHGDLYDELGGNRFSHACPFARIMESGLADRLVQVGIRTMTQHQREQAERFGVEVFEIKDWSSAVQFHLEGPVYISFDLDVLDPAFAPGVSHHEPGGFSTREVLGMIQSLDCVIVGADVVEYNPDRDINGVTAMVAAKVVKELVAKMLRD
jgi:agmatinase